MGRLGKPDEIAGLVCFLSAMMPDTLPAQAILQMVALPMPMSLTMLTAKKLPDDADGRLHNKWGTIP